MDIKNENYTKKALQGTIAIFSGYILTNVFGYLSRLLLARSLTPEHYGLFYSILTFSLFLYIFIELGFNQAMIKYVSSYYTTKKFNLAKSTIYFIFGLQIVTGIIISSLLFLFSDFLAINYFSSSSASFLLKLFAAVILVKAISNCFVATFAGFQRMKIVGTYRFMGKFLFFIGISLLLLVGFERTSFLPVTSYLIAEILILISSFFLILKIIVPKLKGKFIFKKDNISELSQFAFFSTLTIVGTMVIGYIDTLILTYFRTLPEVGIYNTILPTALIFTSIGTSIGTVLMPMISELDSKKDRKKITQALKYLYRYPFLLVIPAALVLFTFPREIIYVLFGPEYSEGAFALKILSIGVIFSTFHSIQSSVLSGLGKPEKVTWIYLGVGLFNFITNILLIPKYGINGAAITTTISYLIILLLLVKSSSNEIKLPKKFVIEWFKLIFSGLIFISIIHIIKTILVMNFYFEAIFCISVAGFVYIGSTYLLRLWKINEIKYILNSLRKNEK